jgi:hypothetical protein
MTPRFFAQLMEHGLVSPELSEAMNDFVDYGRLWKHLLRAPKSRETYSVCHSRMPAFAASLVSSAFPEYTVQRNDLKPRVVGTGMSGLNMERKSI